MVRGMIMGDYKLKSKILLLTLISFCVFSFINVNVAYSNNKATTSDKNTVANNDAFIYRKYNYNGDNLHSELYIASNSKTQKLLFRKYFNHSYYDDYITYKDSYAYVAANSYEKVYDEGPILKEIITDYNIDFFHNGVLEKEIIKDKEVGPRDLLYLQGDTIIFCDFDNIYYIYKNGELAKLGAFKTISIEDYIEDGCINNDNLCFIKYASSADYDEKYTVGGTLVRINSDLTTKDIIKNATKLCFYGNNNENVYIRTNEHKLYTYSFLTGEIKQLDDEIDDIIAFKDGTYYYVKKKTKDINIYDLVKIDSEDLSNKPSIFDPEFFDDLGFYKSKYQKALRRYNSDNGTRKERALKLFEYIKNGYKLDLYDVYFYDNVEKKLLGMDLVYFDYCSNDFADTPNIVITATKYSKNIKIPYKNIDIDYDTKELNFKDIFKSFADNYLYIGEKGKILDEDLSDPESRIEVLRVDGDTIYFEDTGFNLAIANLNDGEKLVKKTFDYEYIDVLNNDYLTCLKNDGKYLLDYDLNITPIDSSVFMLNINDKGFYYFCNDTNCVNFFDFSKKEKIFIDNYRTTHSDLDGRLFFVNRKRNLKFKNWVHNIDKATLIHDEFSSIVKIDDKLKLKNYFAESTPIYNNKVVISDEAKKLFDLFDIDYKDMVANDPLNTKEEIFDIDKIEEEKFRFSIKTEKNHDVIVFIYNPVISCKDDKYKTAVNNLNEILKNKREEIMIKYIKEKVNEFNADIKLHLTEFDVESDGDIVKVYYKGTFTAEDLLVDEKVKFCLSYNLKNGVYEFKYAN